MVVFERTPTVDTPTAHLLAVELYFIIDLNPESLRAFTDSRLTPLSQITVYLNRAILNHEASKPKELSHIKKYYRWKECGLETYQKTIRQQQIQSLLDNFLTKRSTVIVKV